MRRDEAHDAWAVWVKADRPCPGCPVDGDYTRVALFASWLVRELRVANPRLTINEAVAQLYRRI